VRARDSIPCPIEEIRPVDYRNFLAAHAAAKGEAQPPYTDSR
jgi:hypothetical protein